MGTLCQLFKKYAATAGDPGTGSGTDKGTRHSYAETYDMIFKGLSPKHILELGIDSGASLCAWVDYFPMAHVTGIDTTLQQYHWGAAHPRISVFQADATNPSTVPWNHLMRTYDIIIDDASHKLEDQLAALGVFGKLLTSKGIYVIEDVDLKKYPDAIEYFTTAALLLGLTLDVHNFSETSGISDDVLLVLRAP